MFLIRENKLFIKEVENHRKRNNSNIQKYTQLNDDEYTRFRIKKIIQFPSQIQLEQSKLNDQTDNIAKDSSIVVSKNDYQRIKGKLSRMLSSKHQNETYLMKNIQTIKQTQMYQKFDLLLDQIQIFKDQVKYFKLNKINLEKEIDYQSYQNINLQQQVGQYIKDLINCIESYFWEFMTKDQNVSLNSNLIVLDRGLKQIGQIVNNLTMTKNIENEQYLYLLDNLVFFFTLVIDKVIQNSRQSFDQEKLNQIIENQQSQINQLLKDNQNLQKEKQMVQLSMKDLKRQSEESIEKLQDFIIKQKQEIEGYIQRIRELEIEEDPNNLYQNLEIMLHQYNRVFCDIEKQMINDYRENITSLNSFAQSIQENTSIMQNIINSQKNENSSELSKKYGLTYPQKFQKKQQHPFEFYLIQKWKNIKIDNYEKQEDQQILTYLDCFFNQLRIYFNRCLVDNHPAQRNLNRLFINYMFQNQSNIFKISIKLTEICDYLMIQDRNNQPKKTFYQQLLGLNNKQCFNKINLFEFLNIIVLLRNNMDHSQSHNYFSLQQVVDTIITNCDLKFQDEFIEIMQQKMNEVKSDTVQQFILVMNSFYNQQIKKKSLQQQHQQANALLVKLQKTYNTSNFYEIKDNLTKFFESLEPDSQNKVSYKLVQEEMFKRIKIFTSDPSYENIFGQNSENSQLFKYVSFLVQFQKNSLPTEYDNEFIEEYKFYELLVNTFIEYEKKVQQILVSQIKADVKTNTIFALSNFQSKEKIHEVEYDTDIYIEMLNKNMVLQYLDLLKKENNLEKEEQDIIAQVYSKKQLDANIEECKFRIFKKYMKEKPIIHKKDTAHGFRKNRGHSTKKITKKKG